MHQFGNIFYPRREREGERVLVKKVEPCVESTIVAFHRIMCIVGAILFIGCLCFISEQQDNQTFLTCLAYLRM